MKSFRGRLKLAGMRCSLICALTFVGATSRSAMADEASPAPVPQNANATTPQNNQAASGAANSATSPMPSISSGKLQGATGSTVINLIRILVQEGVLTQDKAEALIREAEDEAAAAARAPQEANGAVVSSTAVPAAGPAAASQPTSVRVPYIPQIVRKQIRDEIKQEVLQEARNEHWAAPNALPEWTQRFHLFGDIRLRYEWDLFDPRNNTSTQPNFPANPFPNFAELDEGAPFDLNNSTGTPPPTLDTTEDRQRMRFRVRLGMDVDVTNNFKAGIRLATGDMVNPATTNETLGTTLNKDNFLLDQAFLEYQPVQQVKLWVGRFPNPWLHTDLVWDDNVEFDGIAGQFLGKISHNLALFSNAGAFPIQNTSFNFPDNSTTKQGSRDKWLYAAQAGVDWQLERGIDLKWGGAYYYFSNLEGKLSAPCVASSSSDDCSTDDSRPGFLQQGNTLFAIRDLVSTQTNSPAFQYYGLASSFHDADITARLDISNSSPLHIILDGDVAENIAFNRRAIAAKNPVNNYGTSPTGTVITGSFNGGNLGYQAGLLVGYPDVAERWQWNVNGVYKYLQSDAVPDAFTNSDFHLGGTNAKGYILGGTLGVAHNVSFTARWLSSEEVSGLPYAVDIVQVDLNARY